jgi:predicted PurR-regulated permease PerM
MSAQPQARFNWTARQVILATLFVTAVGLGFWLLYRYRMLVLLLFTAVILGTAIRPLVDGFVKRGLPRSVSLALVYALLLGGFVLFIFLVVPLLISQTIELSASMPQIYLELRAALMKSSSLFLFNIGLNLPADLTMLLNAPPPESQSQYTIAQFIGLFGGFLDGILAAIAVFLLTTFWVLDSERTVRSFLLLMPRRRRQSARQLLDRIESRVGAYLRGQLILSVAIGLLALIAYMILGLPNALVLALIAGVFEVLPVIGPALGAIPALLVAYSVEPALALWVLLATILIQGFENYLLVPRVMVASVGVNPIITLLSLATFTSLLGLPGALLAIPLAAVIQLILDRFVLSTDQVSSPTFGRDMNSVLHYEIHDLISDVRKHLRKKDTRSNDATDQIEESIEALAIEVDLLLSQDGQGEIS